MPDPGPVRRDSPVRRVLQENGASARLSGGRIRRGRGGVSVGEADEGLYQAHAGPFLVRRFQQGKRPAPCRDGLIAQAVYGAVPAHTAQLIRVLGQGCRNHVVAAAVMPISGFFKERSLVFD